jgi:hypothetical protein
MNPHLEIRSSLQRGCNRDSARRDNLSSEAADLASDEFGAMLSGLFLIDQHGQHVDDDPNHSEACTVITERSSRVQPKPPIKGGYRQ